MNLTTLRFVVTALSVWMCIRAHVMVERDERRLIITMTENSEWQREGNADDARDPVQSGATERSAWPHLPKRGLCTASDGISDCVSDKLPTTVGDRNKYPACRSLEKVRGIPRPGTTNADAALANVKIAPITMKTPQSITGDIESNRYHVEYVHGLVWGNGLLLKNTTSVIFSSDRDFACALRHAHVMTKRYHRYNNQPQKRVYIRFTCKLLRGKVHKPDSSIFLRN